MGALAAAEDVQARLGRDLTPTEAERVPALLVEASASARAWMRCTPDPVPADVTMVVARMVARLLTAEESGPAPDPRMQSLSDTAGPFGQTRTYVDGSTSGAPWLTRDDKRILRAYGCRGRVGNVGTA